MVNFYTKDCKNIHLMYSLDDKYGRILTGS